MYLHRLAYYIASPVSNPEEGEAARQNWERFTWLCISKECYKRGFFPATSAYDKKGILRESACPELHRHVVCHVWLRQMDPAPDTRQHTYYYQNIAHYGSLDAM